MAQTLQQMRTETTSRATDFRTSEFRSGRPSGCSGPIGCPPYGRPPRPPPPCRCSLTCLAWSPERRTSSTGWAAPKLQTTDSDTSQGGFCTSIFLNILEYRRHSLMMGHGLETLSVFEQHCYWQLSTFEFQLWFSVLVLESGTKQVYIVSIINGSKFWNRSQQMQSSCEDTSRF